MGEIENRKYRWEKETLQRNTSTHMQFAFQVLFSTSACGFCVLYAAVN